MLTLKILTLLVASTSSIFAGVAGEFYNDEPIKLIDMPVAGSLDTYDYSTRNYFFGDGTLQSQLFFSPYEGIDLGVAYTLNRFLGSDEISAQGIPGIHISYRILDEKQNLPAIKIGFDNQGSGRWLAGSDVHESPPVGLYMAFSKQFQWHFGELSSHLGVGYSLDNEFKDHAAMLWFGMESTLGKHFSLGVEYTIPLGDSFYSKTSQNGLLNTSIMASVSSQITIGFALRNLVRQSNIFKNIDRSLIIEFRL
jgi:hypothetical protein